MMEDPRIQQAAQQDQEEQDFFAWVDAHTDIIMEAWFEHSPETCHSDTMMEDVDETFIEDLYRNHMKGGQEQ